MKKLTLTLITAFFLLPAFSSFAAVIILNNEQDPSDIVVNNGDEQLVTGNTILNRIVTPAYRLANPNQEFSSILTIDTAPDQQGMYTNGITSTDLSLAIGYNIDAKISFSEINIIRGSVISSKINSSFSNATIFLRSQSANGVEINIGENGSLIRNYDYSPDLGIEEEVYRIMGARAIYTAAATTTINNSGLIQGDIEAASYSIINNQAGGLISGNIALRTSDNSVINNNSIIDGNVSGSEINQVINFNAEDSKISGDVSFFGEINVVENSIIGGTLDGNSSAILNIGANKIFNVGGLKDVEVFLDANSNIILTSANYLDNNTQPAQIGSSQSITDSNSAQISGTNSSKVSFNNSAELGENFIIGQVNAILQAVEFFGGDDNQTYTFAYNSNEAKIHAAAVNVYENAILNISGSAVFNSNVAIEQGGEIRLSAKETTLATAGEFHAKNNSLISTNLNSSTLLAGNVKAVQSAIIEEGARLGFTLDSNANNQEVRNYLGKEFLIVQGDADSQIAPISAENIISNDRLQDGENALNRYKSLVASSFVRDNQLILTFVDQKSLVATNAAQENIYDAIYSSQSTSGALLQLQQYLDSYNSDSSKQAALQQASAQSDNAIHRVSFDNNAQIAELISAHLNQNSVGKNLWMQLFGSSSKQENKEGFNGYKNNSFGLIIGGDREITDNFLAGLSLGFVDSKIDSNDNFKNTKIESFQGNIYSRYDFAKIFINSNLGFSFNKYNSQRLVPVTQKRAESNHNGQTYFGQIQVGSNLKLPNNFTATPFLNFTAAKNSVDSYLENGADELNLRVAEKAANFLELRLGGELKKDFVTTSGIKFSPKFSLSVGHDFAGDEQKSTSNFSGQDYRFETTAAKVSQSSVRATIGFNIFQLDKINIDANYLFEARSRYAINAAQLRASLNF